MKYLLVILHLVLYGCVDELLVREEDLNAWVGASVELLDTHPIFLTLPLKTNFSSEGVEIRNYIDGYVMPENISCSSYEGENHSSEDCTRTPSQNITTCNHIFYIKNSYVIEYKPMGHGCATDENSRPYYINKV